MLNSFLNLLRSFLSIHIFERSRLFLIFISRLIYDFYRPPIKLDKAKKFIFNVQYIWAFSELEFMAAAQLKSLGHDVRVIICDGLPYTEKEIAKLKKPSYVSCTNRTKRFCKAYGIEFLRMSSFLSEKDLIEAKKISLKDINYIKGLYQDNIDLSDLAKRNHAHYFKGDIEPVGQYEIIFRKAIESALLVYFSFSKILEKYNKHCLITANGKFIQTAIPALMNQNIGNEYFTYEVFGQGNGVILDKNKPSLEQRMDEVWDDLKKTKLTKKEKERLYFSFKLQEKSESLPFDLWDENRIDDKNKIISMLGIDQKKKIISCYPNVFWDSTHMGLKGVSDNLSSWLSDMVNYAASNSEIELIIRTHPGELKVPTILQSKYTLADTLMSQFERMPNNVHLIEPDSNLSSYAIAEFSDANLVWNGTIGLEFVLRGIKPFVVADAYYSSKGFTNDFLDFDELKYSLNTIQNPQTVSKEERRLAEIFSYHIRFNRKFNPPYYKGTRCYLFKYSMIEKGRNSVLDEMVSYYLGNRSYMNIGKFKFDEI